MSRFTKLGSDGKPLPLDATQWAAVYDDLLKVEWSRTLADDVEHQTAIDNAQALALCGHTDWRLPTPEEAFLLHDRSRSSPAIDTTFFPGTRNDGYWASSVCAGDPTYAWVVYGDDGGVYWGHRGNGYCVRAVRSVAPTCATD